MPEIIKKYGEMFHSVESGFSGLDTIDVYNRSRPF